MSPRRDQDSPIYQPGCAWPRNNPPAPPRHGTAQVPHTVPLNLKGWQDPVALTQVVKIPSSVLVSINQWVKVPWFNNQGLKALPNLLWC